MRRSVVIEAYAITSDPIAAMPEGISNFEALTGRGVKAEVAGTTYYLGNHRLIEELGIRSPGLEETLDRLEIDAKTAVVLGTSNEPLAVLAVANTVHRACLFSRSAMAGPRHQPRYFPPGPRT